MDAIVFIFLITFESCVTSPGSFYPSGEDGAKSRQSKGGVRAASYAGALGARERGNRWGRSGGRLIAGSRGIVEGILRPKWFAVDSGCAATALARCT